MGVGWAWGSVRGCPFCHLVSVDQHRVVRFGGLAEWYCRTCSLLKLFLEPGRRRSAASCTREKNPKAQNRDVMDVAKGHRMSGWQSQGAEVSWVLRLGFEFLVPHRDQERLFHLPLDRTRSLHVPTLGSDSPGSAV